MRTRFPDATKGGPIRAEHIQAIYAALRELEFEVVSPLELIDNTIMLSGSTGFWIKITGAPSGAKHPWQEVFPQTGGTWTNGPRSGTTSTDSAYELNGSTTTLTNKYARAWRDTVSGEIRFQYS